MTVAPRMHAITLHDRAVPLIKTDPQMAYQMLISSVTVDPMFAVGWAMLGASLADLGSLAASCAAYRAALLIRDDDSVGGMTPALRHRCLLQLGHRLTHNTIVNDERLDEAEAALNEALAMGDGFDSVVRAFCHTNLSLIAGHRGDRERELAEAELGYEICPDPAAELGLAFACLHQGHYARGLKHFDARFEHQLGQYLSLPAPRWDGSRVGILSVASEQGLGDALSMARFIPAAAERVETLIYPAQPALVRLLSEALAYLPNVKVVPQDRVIEYADAWCSVFSLAVALGLSDAEIRDAPGLVFDIKPVEDTSWKRKDARLHVAIAWAGSPHNGIDFHRSIPFVEFLALCEVPGIALYSVQVDDRAKELHHGGGTAMVRDMSAWIRDASDTAGILGEMDCVVTAESFVGHLAGAVETRCLLLCSRFGRDWRSSPYLVDRALWYWNHKVFRQGDDLSWRAVFRRVVEELSI